MNLSHERIPANGRTTTKKGTFFGSVVRSGLMTLGLVLVAVIGVQASGNSVGTMPSMAAPIADAGGLNDTRSIYIEGPRGTMQDVLLSANGYGTIQVVPSTNGRVRYELRGDEVLAVFNPEVVLMSDIEIGLVNSDVAMSVTAVMSGGMMTPVTPLAPAEDTPLPVKAWLMSGTLLNESPVIHTVIYSNPVKRVRHRVSMTNGLLQIHQIQD